MKRFLNILLAKEFLGFALGAALTLAITSNFYVPVAIAFTLLFGFHLIHQYGK